MPLFFLASLLSLISSRSFSRYCFTYFSARWNTSFLLACAAFLAATVALARSALAAACLLRRLRIVSGTAGHFLSGILLLFRRRSTDQALLMHLEKKMRPNTKGQSIQFVM